MADDSIIKPLRIGPAKLLFDGNKTKKQYFSSSKNGMN